MRILLLLLLFFCASLFSFAAPAIPFTEAIAQGKISATIKSEGGHTGRCIAVHFERLTQQPITIFIPAGHVFEPDDSTRQNIIVVRREEFTLTAPKQFIRLQGLCAQSGDASPSAQMRFSLGQSAKGNLLKMAEFIAEKRLWNEGDAQYAIWCMSDSLPVAGLRHPALLQMACQLLGQPLPQYKINYPAPRSQPAPRPVPVFEKKPLSIEGAFEFQSNTATEISIHVLNAAGERVETIRENQAHLPGWAKYSFFFQTTKLPSGTYKVVLYEKDKPVKEIRVQY